MARAKGEGVLWFVRQSLVLLVLAWVLGLATGFVLFGRRRGWAEPVTDVIPVIAQDDAEPDGEWVDEGWIAADADGDLRAVVDDGDPDRVWAPVGTDWDPVPAHHDYADPVWAAEAGITDDLLARRADVAPEPVVEPVTEPVAATPGRPVPPVVVPRPAGPSAVAEARVAVPRGVEGGDDLTRIDGVSAETAAALHASGLRSFTAVSRATTDDLRAALSAAGLAPTFKAAYWPLIAADLARSAQDEADAAAADVVQASDDEVPVGVVEEPAAVVPADGTAQAGVAADAADEAGSDEAAADDAAEDRTAADATTDDGPVTVDVTDEAAPVDVTDAAADPLVARITAGGPGARL